MANKPNFPSANSDVALAFEKLEGHEKLCTERWNTVNNRVKRIETAIYGGLAALAAGEFGFFTHLKRTLAALTP